MQKKRIYFLINSLGAGGAERVISYVSNELINEYDIDIITIKNDVFYYIDPRIKHISLSNIKKNYQMMLFFPILYLRLRKLFQIQKYYSGISSLEISNFLHLLTKPESIISFEVNISYFQGFIGKIYRFLIEKLYHKASIIKVNSKENQVDLMNLFQDKQTKIITIYNPIDVNILSQHAINGKIEKKIGSIRGKSKKVFITVGRLVWQKNHWKIIESFANLKRNGQNDFIYIIVGDGPERASLENLVLSYDLSENIYFEGTQEDIYSYLKCADYFVYASNIEGFPNVLIEAMAVGLPIITTEFKTGAQEVIFGFYGENQISSYPIYGPNGILLKKDRFIRDFESLYRNGLSNIRSERKGIEKFYLDSVVEKYKELFESEAH